MPHNRPLWIGSAWNTSGLDSAELERLAALANAETATMESALNARLRALDAERAQLTERATNIRAAGQLLTAQTVSERRTQAQTEANAQRRVQEQAYESDLEQRRRLFAQAQELTQELAGVVRDALAIDSRIYAAALQLGIGTQRGGFAKRALTDFIGRRLSMVGLSDMPRGRLDRNLVD